MATKKCIYKYDNGTSFDEVMFKTTADLVVFEDGKDLQTKLDNGEFGGAGVDLSAYATKDAVNVALEGIEGMVLDTQDEVANVQVGGRNLLLSTRHDTTQAALDGTEYLGLSVLSVTTSPSIDFIDTYQRTALVSGTVYTASFYAKADRDLLCECYFYTPQTTLTAVSSSGYTSSFDNGRITCAITTEWKRYWVTWTQTKPEVPIEKRVKIGRLLPGEGTLSICGMKFEEGNKASDWTPAIEDAPQMAPGSAPILFWSGTQSEYDAIATKDANTLYIVK